MAGEQTVEPSPRASRPPLARRRFLWMAAVVLVMGVAILKFVLLPIKVSGNSMYPNYLNGTTHFILKPAYWSGTPKRGDVVGVRLRSGEIYIKRVVGLPGEAVGIRDGRIWINHEPLDEPYALPGLDMELEPRRLGKNEYFVVGDNRATTVLGAVDVHRIMGRVVF